jgi:hypothetical protein
MQRRVAGEALNEKKRIKFRAGNQKQKFSKAAANLTKVTQRLLVFINQ